MNDNRYDELNHTGKLSCSSKPRSSCKMFT